MKSLPSFVALLCLALLSACTKPHPTDSEAQEFKDGMAFAQDRYQKSGVNDKDVQAMTDYGEKFDEAGAFLNRSQYFCVGAYYQECIIYREWSLEYGIFAWGQRLDKSYTKQAQSAYALAWTELSDNLKRSGFTYEQISKITGKSVGDIPLLIGNEPNQ